MSTNNETDPKVECRFACDSFISTRRGVFCLAVLTISVIVIISVFVVTASSSRIMRDSRLSADEIADAGMAHATAILSSLKESGADDVLRGGDGIPGTGDELANISADLGPVPIGGVSFGGGRFKISISDDAGDDDDPSSDTNGVLLVTVDASTHSGENVTHESEVRIGGVFPAIITNGALRLSGRHTFVGDFSYPQTDGMLMIGDELCVESLTADVASLWQSGNSPDCPLLRSIGRGGKVVSLPAVDVSREFRPMATIILGATGNLAGLVMTGDGRLIHRAGSSRTAGVWSSRGSRWEWNPYTATWRHRGSEIPPGAYHSEGNVEISGPLGTMASPAEITISTEGFIVLAGIMHVIPFSGNYIAMAGTDLLVKGPKTVAEGYSFNGMLRANDQVGVEGFFSLAGSLLSSNMSDDDSFGCFCNPVTLNGGIQEISFEGYILNEGEMRQPTIRNHQRRRKRPA